VRETSEPAVREAAYIMCQQMGVFSAARGNERTQNSKDSERAEKK